MMQLQQIRVEQFQCYRAPFVVDGLTPGLNILSGPNEAGKSTLARAIRTIFLERYSAGTLSHLQPQDDSAASPSVELEFLWQGRPWRLSKQFLKKKRCLLSDGHQQWDGEEAEQRLAEMMGFGYSKKGLSKPEHWGVPGLLWVEQGSGQEWREPVAHAADYLQQALGDMVGASDQREGDGLLRRAEAELAQYLTARTAKPTGAYLQAIQQAEEARQQSEALHVRLQAYRQQVDELATLLQRHRQDSAQRPWESLRHQQAEAEQKLVAIRQLQARQEQDRQAADQTTLNLQLQRETLLAQQQDEQQAQTRAQACQQADAQAESTAQALALRRTQTTRAQAAWQQAQEALARSQSALRGLQLRQQGEILAQRQQEFQDRLAQAQRWQQAWRDAQQAEAALAVDEAVWKQWRQDAQQLRELDIQRQGLATRIRYRLVPGQTLQLGAAMLQGEGEQPLLEAATLSLPGVGELELIPGVRDLAELGRRHSELEARCRQHAQALGLETLAAVEARHAQAQRHQADGKHAQTMLQSLAAKGVAALEAEHGALQLQVQRQTQDWTAWLAHWQQLHPGQDWREAAATEADEHGARRQADLCREHLQQAERQQHDAVLAHQQAQQQARHAHQEHEALQTRLADPARLQQLRAGRERLLTLQAEAQAQQARIEARQRDIDAARPDLLEQDIQRLTQSARHQETAFLELGHRLDVLRAQLESLGAQGLDTQYAEADATFEQAERRRQQLAQRAQALQLLVQLLSDKRQILIGRLQAPLQQHLQRYLPLLYPQAGIALDETLQPASLTRDGRLGTPLEALSFGSREQIGLACRLAYADLLQQAGRPTLLILDDALVHTDEARLAQMKRMLFDAAQRHQILLLTCHPDKWRDMGVPVRTPFTAQLGVTT